MAGTQPGKKKEKKKRGRGFYSSNWKPYWKSKSRLTLAASCTWSMVCVRSWSCTPTLAASWSARLSWSTIATSSPNVFSLDRILSLADESCIVVASLSTSCSSEASPPLASTSPLTFLPSASALSPFCSLPTASFSPTCVVLAVLSPVSNTLACELVSS
jgi:hypothetical protein